MTALSTATLGDTPATVATPDYARSHVTVGIVHIGVGGFHRAHEALYVDRLLASDPAWGICGLGVRDDDSAMRDALAAQDGLYTLTTVAPDGAEEAAVIGSIVRLAHLSDGADAVVELMADPGVRIVSLTITEGGYAVDEAGVFRPTDPATVADLEGAQPPRSAFGLIVAALRARHDRGLPPFTVMSCDNVQHNGRVARAAVEGMADARDAALVAWIRAEGAFPNSMVDRITPVTTDAVRSEVAERTGIEDRVPVRAESFLQWVLEDDFACGRPVWEDAGVQVVADVDPYERMKLRLLNASHQAMSYTALLAGLSWVHEACRDPQVVALIRAWMADARETLPPVPGVDLDVYCDVLIDRFASEAVRDTLARQVVSSSDRLPTFVVPVIADLAAGGRIETGAFVLAAWSAWLAESLGEPERVVDPRRDVLLGAARREEQAGGAHLLDLDDVFGRIGANEQLREAYLRHRAAIRAGGVRAAIDGLLATVG